MPCQIKKPYNVAYDMNYNNSILEAAAVQYGFFSSAEIWAKQFDQMIPTLFHVTSLDDEIEMWVKFAQDMYNAININILLSTELDEDPFKGDKIIKDIMRPNL